MHDLIHDLATFLAGAFYFRSEDLGKETMTRINRKTRHLSFNECNFPFLENSEVFESIKFLRTFLPPKYLYYHFNNQEKEVRMLLSKLKCARVLSFQCFGNLSVLPDTIGELIHLRYLDLSGTDIMALPESLCDLYNLQTLKLYDCGKLTILPSGMQKLVNLLHLDIRTTPLEEMPKGMSKLNQLQYLSDYIVGKHEENGIKELGGLSNLHGWLSIIRLENVRNDDEAKEARIMDKKHVEKLELHWSSDTGDNSQTEMNILCKLQPHWDLQSLLINGYRGTTFPDWVGNSSYNTMTALTLSSCKNCVTLPSLGQLPSLKNMWISDLDRLKTIDGGFYGNINDSSLSTPFPILESLVFEDMPCWEMWSSFEPLAFPQLKKLQIRNCLRLSGELPNHLPALKDLHIESCNQLDSSLPMAPLICDLRIIRSDKVAFMKEQKHELLESLELNNSRNSLSSLPLETFPNLKRLYLIKYDSQSEEGLGAPSSDKLKSLICQMNTLFPNLEHLTIEHCPGIESFPEGGMPPSLRKIVIGNCEKLLSGSAWPSMDLLTRACISGPCDGMKSFPMEGLLPPSLTSLTLNEFSSLETLDCKGLLHLTSLRQLQIEYCRKLENITGERLPASLIELDILRCPLLEERCRMKDPQIWPKISHIQSILINWKPIS